MAAATQNGMLLLRAISHGTEHRVQVAVVLSQQGITPPELDGWAYHAAGGFTE